MVKYKNVKILCWDLRTCEQDKKLKMSILVENKVNTIQSRIPL